MSNSGIELEDLSKRELVALLIDAVKEWSGVEPLHRDQDRYISETLDLLMRCTVLAPERHWLHLCDHWLADARRKPNPETRKQWLQHLGEWHAFTRGSVFLGEDPSKD